MAIRRRPRMAAPRRKLIWARSQDVMVPALVPAAGTAVDLLAQFRTDGGSTLGCTVTRVLLDFQLLWTNDITTTDAMAVGVIVDQLQAAQTEVPRPGVEPHADWMYWRRTGVSPVDLAITPSSTAVQSALAIDVKSQRKMEELGQTLWLVIDPTFGGTTTLTAQVNSSVLLRLP